MAASRKRPSSGFTAKTVEEPKEEVVQEKESATEETKEILDMLDELAVETFEGIDEVEHQIETFVVEEIVPTEDPGPRFVQTEEVSEPVPTPVAPKAPKRHPRNIPKFSRLAK